MLQGHFWCHQLRCCRALLPLGVITLDPQTASGNLVLSEDRKSVRYKLQKQNAPDSPRHSEGLPSVLGSPGFSAGRHRWQVDLQLGEGGGCAVGVAGAGVRGGAQGLNADRGVWAVVISDRQCWASTCPVTDLRLDAIPRSVAVALDYDAGRVALHNAETQAHIFTFTASFSGEVFPLFATWKKGSCLTLKG